MSLTPAHSALIETVPTGLFIAFPVVGHKRLIAGIRSTNTIGFPIVNAPNCMNTGCSTPALSPNVVGIFDAIFSALIMFTRTSGENGTAWQCSAKFG